MELIIKDAIRQKKFLKLFKSNKGNIRATCKAIGINHYVYYRWMVLYTKFKEKVLIIKASGPKRYKVNQGQTKV